MLVEMEQVLLGRLRKIFGASEERIEAFLTLVQTRGVLALTEGKPKEPPK